MPRRLARTSAVVVTGSLLAATASVIAPSAATAAVGTVLFQNSFADRTVAGTGTVTTPTPVSGPNVACLTVPGNSATLPLLSCSTALDPQGAGKLQLTPALGNKVGAVFGQNSFPSSNGLDVTFNSYQWGGNSADGLAFMLAAVDPANPVPPTSIGSSGGALGYSAAPGLSGLTNAYLGVGIDVFGNFSNSSYSGTGCPGTIPNFGVATPGAVAVRGPGNVRVGYCGLTTTSDGTPSSKLTLRAVTRALAGVPVQVLINPTAAPFTSATGVTVAAGGYKIVLTPVGQTTRTLTGTLPAVAAGLYPAASWLNAAGVPKQLAFGFVGSTGSVTDVHEISDVKVLTFNPVPQLAVSSTSYSAAAPVAGAPVNYRVTASVLAGSDETSPVSVTQTAPAGVVPVGAYGTGWACLAPSGQTVTCTTTGSAFPNGTALPVITVVAIVTGSSVTAALVQGNSPVRASSADANPGTDTTAAAGTVPTAPGGVAISPATGPVGGGATTSVTATTSVPPTAVEIGTAAEMQAGTPVMLLPCAAGRAAGCVNIEGGTFVLAAMPARATAGTVGVTVVTLGTAGATSYVYVDRPGTPAAPTATPGITSATITWVAPAANGSAITGYLITPYLAGVTQPAQAVDATATTRTLTGLTAGGSYTFTVAAVNAQGTSNASAPSAAVVPYTLPGAPAITAVTAGTAAATLTWTTPGNGGTPITGYLLTPYIGTVAQPGQAFAGAATTRTVTGLTAGTAYTFTVAAQNLAGTGPASAASAPVTPNVSPSLTFPAPPAGEVGVAYSRPLTVSNGTAPFTWSVSAGALPAGLTVNAATGLLSGTPTAAGTSAFTVQVVDASGQAASRAVTLVIAAAPSLAFSPAAGEVNVAYSQQPTLTGGTAPITWAVTAGSLPAGLALNPATGLLSGTPTAAGSFSLTVAATDAFGQAAGRTVTLVVVPLPAFTGPASAAGQVGVAYGATTLGVSGGTAPLTWAVTAGSLPPGLALATGTGVLSGTPTTVGTSAFTVSVVDANAQSASTALTLTVGAGPLVIVKAADTTSAAAGSTVGYTITVTNTGAAAVTGVALTDPLTAVLDDASYDGNATATGGTVSYAAPSLGWTGTVPAGGVVTIAYSVTVHAPDAGNKVLANTVSSATLGTNCAGGSADPRCSATVTVPGLTIVASADAGSTTPGSTVRFTVVVTNAGQTAYAAATLTVGLDGVLDDAAYNADGTATAGTISFTGSALTWTGGLAVGASATITYSVTVASPDAGNRSLASTVVSATAGSPCPADAPAAQCTVTVPVLVPGLAIGTTATAATTTPGGTVGYTMTLANTGQTAYPATSVTLDLGGTRDDATYDGNATASAGTLGYDAGAGTLTWTGGLAVGALVTVTASVTVRNPDPGGKVLTTLATSAAPGSTCPAGGTNPACATTVQVRVPALTVAVSADAGTTTPGSVVRYTVTATNTGQTPYAAATLAAALAGVLDDAGYDGNAAATAGTVTFGGSTLTWTGALPIGATATITYSVTVRAPDPGDRTLGTAVTSTTPGSTCPAGGTDPRCASTVTVLVPGLDIVSALEPATTTPGSVVRYSATVRNTGQTAYTGTAITLDLLGALDDATYNNDATITTGDLVTNPDGTVDWVLSLAPGASAVGRISMTVNSPAAGDRSLRITAVSAAPGSTCPAGAPAAACAAVATVLLPGLTVTKTADTSTVIPGGTVGYTIGIVNDGQTAYAAATVTDDLSTVLTDATYAGGATATTGAVTYGAPVLTWTGALAPGESATVAYTVTVRDPDPGDKRMYNTAVSAAAGANCVAGGADPRCTATVDVLVPGLTVLVTAGTATAVPGATVGHTVDVTNSGATPLAGATITAALAGVLDDAAYNGDAAASTGTVGVTGTDLTWTGDLAVGASARITYSVTVHTADGGDDLLTTTVSSGTRGANCPDPRCTAVVPVARLVLTQGYPEPTTTPGALLHLSATFANTGQVAYTGITVSSPSGNTVDDATPTGDQVATSGTLLLTATAITWSGSIPVGGTVTVTGTLTVHNPDLGNRLVTGTLISAAPGNTCPAGGTDARCTALVTVLVPGLTIAKTADTTATVPGGTVAYTITVRDSGETAYTADTDTAAAVADSLAGVLDDATYDGNATATAGAVSYAAPTLSWIGDLAPGETATITYSVTARTDGTGDKTAVNPVSSTTVGSTCPPASGTRACRSTVLVLTPALTLVATADLASATLGSTVTYTVRATNSGQTPYPAASYTVPLAGVLDDAAYNGDATATGGTVGYAAGTLSWTGALAPGASATVTYTVTIANPATGDDSMTSTVASTTDGGNCPVGAGDSRCTATVAVTEAVSLTFTKVADVDFTVAGSVVHYTLTVVNSSTADVAGADLTDPLAGILDDAAYNGDATATGGTVGVAGATLTWTGTAPALGTVTITYSVTVHAAATGDQVLDGTVSSTSLPASDNCVAGSGDPRCTSRVPVAALLIRQSYAETTATPGTVLHVSATFTNTGQQPYTGISIAALGDDAVDDAIGTGDQAASSGTLVLGETGLTWIGNIPVGGEVTLTATLTVQDPDPGNRLVSTTLVSAAPGNNCPAGGTDARCTGSVAVLLPGLTIATTASTTFVVPGGTVGYTVTVHNTGDTPYTGAVVTDSLLGVLDDAALTAPAVASAGTLAYDSPILTWTGDLAVGATATITYSVTADNPAAGDKTMVNAVSSAAVGSTCPPASGTPACRTVVAVLTPALTVTAAAGATTAVPGATVAYTVTVANTGQVPFASASVAVPLAGVLDDATYGGGATATTGSVAVAGSTLTWTGAFGTGATATIGYAVRVDDPVTGDFRLAQTVTSATPGSTCPAGGTDPRCTTSVPIATLRIGNAADAATTTPTAVVRNTVTFTNAGQVPYVGISLTDAFAGSLDDATYNGDAEATAGSLLLVTGTGRIVWTGDLAVGETVVVTGSLTVDNPDLGDRTMTTLVSTGAAASNCPPTGTDPACATAVAVLTPALTIAKTADTATTVPGGTVGYTITVTNSGQAPYTAARLADPLTGVLANATYNGDATATGGTVSLAGAVLGWTGDLAVGASATIAYSVRVNDPDLGDKIMVNTVESGEVGSDCPAGGPAPGCTAVVTVLVPALDIAVAADTTTTVPGGTVGYTVTIANTGEVAYLAATVTTLLAGVLDDAGYAGDATATTGTVTFAAPELTWTGDLAVGASAVVTYTVTVADPDTGDHLLATTVTSTAPGSTCGCANTVTVLIPGLAVSTTASVATATPGEQVVFTITVANTGQTPYPPTTVRTDLTGVLDDAAFDGQVTASLGVAGYAAPQLSWTGALPVGATAVITYTVTVRNPDGGDRVLATTVVAPAAGSTCPQAGADPACTATVTVLVPGLTVSKSADAATTTPGGVVGYTILIANTGQTGYAAATVADSLAGVLTDADYGNDATVVGGGTLTFADSTLRWSGALLVGAGVTITYSVTVHDPDTGDKELTNAVTSTTPGATCPPGGALPACATVVRVLVPALSIAKTADATTVVAGGAVRYTVTVTNGGQTAYLPARFTDTLGAVLDDASYNGDATATAGTVEYAGGTLSWTGPLAVGATATVTYSVTTGYPATGDRTLTNAARSTSAGATCDPGCDTVVSVLVPALTVSKAADAAEVVAGGTVHYTLTATNDGQADYPTATLTDSLAGLLDDAAYNGDATATRGSVTYAGGTLAWTGGLPVGATVLVGYSVTAAAAGTGDGVLANRVVSASVGSTCTAASTGPPCATATTVAALAITLTGLTPSFTLAGLPDSTVSSDGALTMTVTTNSPGGYQVTVQAGAPSLTGGTPGNTATIPVGLLSVRESGTPLYRILSATTALVVHQQDGPSAPGGDAVSNDYRIEIPFVAADTYSTTLDYIVSAR
jgi:uncharacterized repeat protein (TIGR01451 family)